MTAPGDDLRRLAQQLRDVDVAKVVSPVLSKAGAKMRDAARAAAPKGPHLPGYASTIIFDRPDPLTVDMGAQAVGQGNLSAVLEFGQGANAPHPHILPQLDAEADTAAEWMGKALGDAL